MLMPIPSIVSKVLDKLYGESYINWEPETLEAELSKLNHETLNAYGKDGLITSLINAIRAVKSPKSYALQEWHLFENVIAALTGKRVLPFEAQPPSSVIELFYGVENLKDIFEHDLLSELSEETLLYIGLNLTGAGIFAFPFEPYKSAISLAIKHEAPKDAQGSIDAQCMQMLNDFEKKLMAFIKNKQAVIEMLQLIEASPNTDVLSNIGDVNTINAVTAVCSYILVRNDLTDNDTQQAFTNSVQETESSTIQAPELPEGIDENLIDEIYSFFEPVHLKHASQTMQVARDYAEKAAARYVSNNQLPKQGLYLVTPDPDEFDTGHRYEGAINSANKNSVISTQESGSDYYTPAGRNLKVLNTKQEKKPETVTDAISRIFAGLEI